MSDPAGEHALPCDPSRLIELLAADGTAGGLDAPMLRRVAAALRGQFHHELFAVKERMRAAWTGLDLADGDVAARSNDQCELATDLLRTLRRLLVRANFVDVSIEELERALRIESSFGLKLDLDLADFEDLRAWRRIETTRKTVERRWFGLRRRTVAVATFDRFCVFARFKRSAHFDHPKRLAGKLGARPGGISLRLYRDVPKHDVEALFPGVRVRMGLFDRALIGVPAAAGALQLLNWKLISSLYALGLGLLVFLGLRKEEPQTGALAIGQCAGLALLVTFLFRQWARFLGRKNVLHRQLAEHLHRCTLDSGLGVLLHLLDEAEAQETGEALLAWVLLLRAGGPITPAALDRRVEEWLGQRAGVAVDFEEEDALHKLERLGLATRDAAGTVVATPPLCAIEQLETRWGGLFRGR
ncbi:MAG: DUF3754 domain-containing protein [Planctomycetes bacterium]|nr:DUF3754 domain-containing protein [Planctomycetota bacterium]